MRLFSIPPPTLLAGFLAVLMGEPQNSEKIVR